MRKKLFAMLLCAALTLGITACGTTDSNLYEEGMAAMEQGDYAGAAEKFTDAIEARERLAENWRALGIAWYKQGKYDQAESAFEFALESMDREGVEFSRDVMLYRAKNLTCMGDAEGALTVYNQLLENNPEDSEIYFLRGKSSMEEGDVAAAGEDFQKAVSYAGNYSMCLSVYELYAERSLKADGEIYLKQALQYAPETEEDYHQLGCIYYYLQMTQEASNALSRAVELGNTDAMGLLGNMYLELGDLANARQVYQKCMSDERFQTAAMNGLAICEIEEGNYDRALEYINQGLAAEDTSQRENLLFNEVVVYEKQGNYALARDKINALLEEFPDCEEAQRESIFLNR